jgi:hypothetical protein
MEIPIEDMSHLLAGFELPTKLGDPDYEEPIKTRLYRKVKVLLMFIVQDEDEHKFISVRVPKGLPTYRLRQLNRHVEEGLRAIYPKAYRLNFYLVSQAFPEKFEVQIDPPTFQVVYV